MFFNLLFIETSGFSTLTTLDIVLGILLAIGLIRGFMKGFIIEIAGLVALFLGIYGAIHFSYFLVAILQQNLSWSEQYINITAFILTFIIIVVCVSLLGKLFTRLINLVALGILNRIFGGIFGLLKVAFILSVLILFFSAFNQGGKFIKQKTLKTSLLYTPLKEFGEFVLPSVMEKIEQHRPEKLQTTN